MFRSFKRYKKVLAIIVAIVVIAALVLPILYPVFVKGATSLEDQLKKQQNIQQQLQKQIEEAKQQKNTITTAKKAVDDELSALDSEIDVLNNEIATLDAQIDAKQTEMDEAQKVIDKQQNVYKKRMRTMYEEGNTSYISALLDANSLNDFFYRYEMVKEILEYDRKLLSDMEQARKVIELSKAEIEAAKATVAESKKTLVDKKSAAEAKRQEQQKMINELTQNEEKYNKELSAARAAEQSLKNQISGSLSNSNNSTYSGGKFAWPTPGYTTITSPFDMRNHPVLGVYKMHTGVDIGAPNGSNIIAAGDGTVVFAGWNGGYGNCVIIDHGGGYSTLYAHASSLTVSKGQKVSRGQTIAKVGSTGMSTGPHLHFEVMINGSPVEPTQYCK